MKKASHNDRKAEYGVERQVHNLLQRQRIRSHQKHETQVVQAHYPTNGH
jgi:hypothetical protein